MVGLPYEIQQFNVELKGKGELAHQLEDTVQVLDKNGRYLLGAVVLAVVLPRPLPKFMAAVPPVLLEEHDEALNGPEVGIEDDLGQRGELGGPVPAIAAVDHNVGAVPHALGHILGPGQDEVEVVDPAGLPQNLQEVLLVGVVGSNFVVAVPDGVDVGDVQKFNLAVVVFLTLEALAGQLVAPSGVVPPRIEYLDIELSVETLNFGLADDGGSSTDALHHFLVLGASVGEDAPFVLAAPEERGEGGGLVLVEVGEDGQPLLRPEIGTFCYLLVVHLGRDYEMGGVGGRQLECLVADQPVRPFLLVLALGVEVLVDSLPFHFPVEVVDLPAIVDLGNCVGKVLYPCRT